MLLSGPKDGMNPYVFLLGLLTQGSAIRTSSFVPWLPILMIGRVHG